MTDRPNISDRGNPRRPSDPDPVDVDDERPDAIHDHRLDDVRSLTSEDIAELGERYGEMRVAGEIAGRAMAQLASVKLVIDRSPSGQRQIYRDGESPYLTPDDRRYLRSRELAASYHLFHNAEHNVHALLVDVVGEERARELHLSDEAIRRVASAPKRERRKALARELDNLPRSPALLLEQGDEEA